MQSLIPISFILGLISILPSAAASPVALGFNIQTTSRQSTGLTGALFGPLTIPAGSSVNNANLTLINLADEVFDISSISIFGDINDGGCEKAEDGPEPVAADSGAERNVVLGPASIPWSASEIQDSQVTLINFGDEVFDISSISVFGDINDGACPPAAAKKRAGKKA